MADTIQCAQCSSMLYEHTGDRCHACGKPCRQSGAFQNSDEALRARAAAVIDERKKAGIEGLVGDLDCVIINTEPENWPHAGGELLRFTGLECREAFEDPCFRTLVLSAEGSASYLVRTRLKGSTPFIETNRYPKSARLPSTRLETLVFRTPDIRQYVAAQRALGTSFLTEEIEHHENFSFIQTAPSLFTGNSLGFIERHGTAGSYMTEGSTELRKLEKPLSRYLHHVRELDHAATRVRAEDRDNAILEFMRLTSYSFDFAIYVESLNSITNVARLKGAVFSQVFTSGITSFAGEESSGPTEKFIHHYGPRVHHLAFRTECIEEVFEALKSDGMGFLIELVGSPEEGLRQTFSDPSPYTFLVCEYIHRYGDFDGFFTKSNVTALTQVTGSQ